MNSLDETKQHEVLTISASELGMFGLKADLVQSLTWEDMERIALELHERYVLAGFEEDALFVARLILAEKENPASAQVTVVNIKEDYG